MPAEIVMPRVAPAMTEGVIVEWLKNEGDIIKKGDPVAAITSEKATFEIESLYDGVIQKLLYNPGDEVPVNKPIAIVTLPGEKPGEIVEKVESTKASAGSSPVETKELGSVSSGNDTKIKASPLAKNIAKQEGVDLAEIIGTGPGGRIVKQDVLGYLEMKSSQKAEQKAVVVEEEDKRIPFVGVRKETAKRLQISMDNVIPVTSVTEIDVTELVQLRERLKKDWLEMFGTKVTLNAFIIRAVALALKKHSALNSQLDGDSIVIKAAVNIGLAMNNNNNLYVPVIRNADKLSVLEIAQEIEALVKKVRNNTITLADMQGGTFTITNVGPMDVQFSTPVINYPQAGILGIGTINVRPAFLGDEIVKRHFCYISLTYNHKIIDGAPAAEFRKSVKAFLENPYLLLK